MSTDTTTQRSKHPRPSVVTLSCVFVAVTAFLTLTELISALMDWGTVGMQQGLQPMLRGLRAAGLEVTTTELLRVLRWCALALVPFTVSALVFSLYAMRGDRAARFMTSALAITAAFISMLAGISIIGAVGLLQASMLLIAAGALWSPDASRWYRGEPALARPAKRSDSPTVDQLAVDPPALAAPAQPRTDGPPMEPTQPTTATTATLPSPPLQIARPTSVTVASVITILGSLAAGAFASLYLVIYNFARDEYINAVKSGPFGDMISAKDLDLMMTVTFWASVGILPLALIGLMGAAALLARRRLGRTTTLCCAWVSAALGLAMLPIGLLATAGAAAVIVLLSRDDARQWTGSR